MTKEEMREAGPRLWRGQCSGPWLVWHEWKSLQADPCHSEPRVLVQLTSIFQKIATEMLEKKFAIPEYLHDPALQISPQSTAVWKKYFKHGLFTVVPIIIQLTRIRLEAEPSNRLLQLQPEKGWRSLHLKGSVGISEATQKRWFLIQLSGADLQQLCPSAKALQLI